MPYACSALLHLGLRVSCFQIPKGDPFHNPGDAGHCILLRQTLRLPILALPPEVYSDGRPAVVKDPSLIIATGYKPSKVSQWHNVREGWGPLLPRS